MKNIGSRLQLLFPVALNACVLGLFAVTFANFEFMQRCFVHSTYYIVWGLFVTWAAYMIWYLNLHRSEFRDAVVLNRHGIAASLLLALLVFLSIKPQIRVVIPEANLLASAHSLLYEKRADFLRECRWIYGNLVPLSTEIPVRPLLFPFFLHLCHIAFGYRIENVYYLNAALLFACCSLLYAFMRRYVGAVLAVGVLFLFLAHPIVTLTASSAISDLLAIALNLVCLIAARNFMERPQKSHFQWLWINLLMLAHVREESFVFFFLTVAGLLALRCFKKEYFRNFYAGFLTPLFLLPIVWQLKILSVISPNVHVQDYMTDDKVIPAWSIGYLVRNTGIFVRSLFNFKFYLSFANLVNLIGLAGLALFLYALASRKSNVWKETASRNTLLIIAFNFLGTWLIYTAKVNDVVYDATANRYYFLTCILLACFTVWLFFRLADKFNVHRGCFLALCVGIFCLYHPVAMADRIYNDRGAKTRDYRLAEGYFKNRLNKNTLVISSFPNWYLIEPCSAIYFSTANKTKTGLLNDLGKHLYENIYVVQIMDLSDLKPVRNTFLDPEFKLQTVHEAYRGGDSTVRISRVSNFDQGVYPASPAKKNRPIRLNEKTTLEDFVPELEVYLRPNDGPDYPRIQPLYFDRSPSDVSPDYGAMGAVHDKWVLGDSSWSVVGRTRMQMGGGITREGIWAHPWNGKTLVVEAKSAVLKDRLNGYAALTDAAVKGLKGKKGGTVYFKIYLNNALFYKTAVSVQRPYQEISLPIERFSGTPVQLTATVEADDVESMHFVFDLWGGSEAG